MLGTSHAAADTEFRVQIASKKFTESVILGEVLTQLIETTGTEASHQRELGGTRILWNALVRGEIHAYPEYTGTIREEILAGRTLTDDASVVAALTEHGIRMTRPLGFNNTYAIGMRKETARSHGVRTISDLARLSDLRLGFTNEFMDRGDGWPGLRDHYNFQAATALGLDHDLAYRGLASGTIDAMDLYSTDAEIRYYDLHVLEDDRGYFPEYQAVVLYRDELERRHPELVQSLRRLENAIPESLMIAMNARVKLERLPETDVARAFLRDNLSIESAARGETRFAGFLRHTREHLALVGISLFAAILVAVPLGILASRHERLGQFVLGATGVIQTIPSLALLVFMIPILGIGAKPAIMALFLYSLLPIVRNTFAGLQGIPLEIRESAQALGLPVGARLRRVELPMASRSILAGIKTSAVINIGTATLGALIGAGGYGQPILTGIRLDDAGLILQGAVPAAALALAAQGIFEVLERWFVPRGLRLRQESATVG